MNTHAGRSIARIVGVVYIAGMVLGIVGNTLVQSVLTAPDHLSTMSANSMQIGIGALLWLITVVGDAAHGVLMYPILQKQSARFALGYFGARIVDALFVAIQVLFMLMQIPLGSHYLKAASSDRPYLQTLSGIFEQGQVYSYQIGMLALGLAGMILCFLLYRGRLVPRLVAVWGLLGYAVLLGGSVLEILGFNLNLIHTIPGGLWELFIGVWLIVKGFSVVVEER